MSAIHLPALRPAGRALIIGSATCRSGPLDLFQRLGYSCASIEDPYTAMAELCRRPSDVRAIVLSLASLYREELTLIRTVKRRWPVIDVWLAQTEGRHAALADALAYGADGVLDEDGVHRTGTASGKTDTTGPANPEPASAVAPVTEPPPLSNEQENSPSEPILTAEELRALLSEPIVMPEETQM